MQIQADFKTNRIFPWLEPANNHKRTFMDLKYGIVILCSLQTKLITPSWLWVTPHYIIDCVCTVAHLY